MFSSHSEIMQAAKESTEYGRKEEHRRVHYAAMTVPEKRIADFPQLDTNSAAMVATGWNECRAAMLKAIGVSA